MREEVHEAEISNAYLKDEGMADGVSLFFVLSSSFFLSLWLFASLWWLSAWL